MPVDNKWTLITKIRSELGLSLREANDFYMRDPATAEARLATELQTASTSKVMYETRESQVRSALHRHYDRLNKNLDVPGDFIKEVEHILGQSHAAYNRFHGKVIE